MSLVWVNGTLVDKTDARVSPFDHGFLYGDGVWIPLRVRAERLERPEKQLQHLYAGASRLGIEVPFSPVDLLHSIYATLGANNRTNGYIRVIVSRGPGTIGPDHRKIVPQVLIVAEEYQPFPAELYEHGLHAVSYPVPLDPRTALLFERALGQPHLVLAKRHALQNGCLESILFDKDGRVLGATEGSVLIVKDNAMKCPDHQPPEVLTSTAAAICSEHQIPFHETTALKTDLLQADELLLVGTSCGVIGIIRFDDQPIGSGQSGRVTKLLREGILQKTN
jgi:branched-chain amino acid aminotransferase